MLEAPSIRARRPFAMTDNFERISERVEELKLEHRDLDHAISSLLQTPFYDELQLRRLKKRKLLLKDQISFLEAQLHPDVPA